MVDLMENSSTGGKRKRSPTKPSPTKNVKDMEPTDVCSSVDQKSIDDSNVKKELFINESDKSEEMKKTPEFQLTVGGHNETKGKKKNVAQGKKPMKKKKSVKKKTFSKDEDDFKIDPRLGGNKIKQSISNKAKDKKLKSHEQEHKKHKTLEQRFPYIHIEGAWNMPSVVKIVNGHAKVINLITFILLWS